MKISIFSVDFYSRTYLTSFQTLIEMRSSIPSSSASASAMRTVASSSSPSQFLRPRASAAAAAASSRSLSSLPPTAAKFMVRIGAFRPKLNRLDSIATSASSDDEAASTSSATSTSPNSTNKDDDDLWIEQELRRRKKARGAKSKSGGPNVIAPAVSRAKGETAAQPADGAEAAALQFLGAFFVVLLLEGLALAASGFFPESVDAFITEKIYPSYSPQLGVFLLCSSLYGLWKSKQN